MKVAELVTVVSKQDDSIGYIAKRLDAHDRSIDILGTIADVQARHLHLHSEILLEQRIMISKQKKEIKALKKATAKVTYPYNPYEDK